MEMVHRLGPFRTMTQERLVEFLSRNKQMSRHVRITTILSIYSAIWYQVILCKQIPTCSTDLLQGSLVQSWTTSITISISIIITEFAKTWNWIKFRIKRKYKNSSLVYNKSKSILIIIRIANVCTRTASLARFTLYSSVEYLCPNVYIHTQCYIIDGHIVMNSVNYISLFARYLGLVLLINKVGKCCK